MTAGTGTRGRVAAARYRAVARLLAGRDWAVWPTATSIAASGTAAGTTFVIAWGIGAAAFGQFAVVLSVALIVSVGMLMCLNYVMLQELPRAAPADRPALMATALLATLALSAGLVAAGLAAAPLLRAAFAVDTRTLCYALALAFSLTVNQLTESLLRGLRKFGYVAGLKLAIALAYLAVCGYLLLGAGVRNAERYLVALITTNLLFAAVAAASLRIGPRRWSPRLVRSLYRHGAYITAITALTTVLFGVDVIFLNHWAGRADVGVYSIYNGLPKRLLGVVFTEGIGLVLLPTLAMMDKPTLLRRISRLAPAVAAAAAALTFAASAVLLLLLPDYPYSFGLMALAAAGIGTHTVFNLYFFALSMDGVRGARVFVACLGAGLPAALAGQAASIAWWGLIGALVAFPLTNIVLVTIVVAAVRRVYQPQLSTSEGTA